MEGKLSFSFPYPCIGKQKNLKIYGQLALQKFLLKPSRNRKGLESNISINVSH